MEAVTNFAHQLIEHEKQIRLEEFTELCFFHIVLEEAVIKHCYNFIHALNVSNPRIEFCKDEQNPAHHVSVRLDVVGLVLRGEFGLAHFALLDEPLHVL